MEDKQYDSTGDAKFKTIHRYTSYKRAMHITAPKPKNDRLYPFQILLLRFRKDTSGFIASDSGLKLACL